MALNLNTRYPNTNPADADFPQGSIKNDTVPGDKTGTPVEKDWLNDYVGFTAALLNDAGVTPSGDVDTALSSDRLKAIRSTTVRKISSVFNTSEFAKLKEGDVVEIVEYHPDSGVGGGSAIVRSARHNGGTSISLTRARPTDWSDQTQLTAWFADSGADELCAVRVDSTVFIENYGAKNGTDIQKIYEKAVSTNSVIYFNPDHIYELDSLVVTPSDTIVDFQGTQINVNSTNYGFVMGSSGDALQYRIHLLNLKLVLTNKTVHALWSRANARCKATGYIEGPVFGTAEDATRTNIGLWIDGANASSFFNEWDIQFNHVHESIRIATTGTTFATAQTFINCNVFGDSTTDPLAKGFNIGNGNGRPEAQGSVIIGGNIEKQGVGIDVSNFAGPIAIVGTRFEEGSNDVDVWYRGNNPAPSSIFGCGSHVNVVWDNPSLAGTVFFGPDGSLGRPDGGQKYNSGMTLLMDSNNSFNILTPEDSTGTGRVVMQAGAGSTTFGAGFTAYAAAHPSFAGDFIATTSGSGVFGVGVGVAGAGGRIFKVAPNEITAARDNTASIGSAAERYTQVFAVTGTINTSDEREKTEILAIDEKLKAVALEIKSKIGVYQWLSSVEEKGTENARWHFGVGAQTVKQAFENQGLDGFDYGCLCYDEWDEVPEKTIITSSLDENGQSVDDEVVVQEFRPAGNRYGVRVDQLLFLMLAT